MKEWVRFLKLVFRSQASFFIVHGLVLLLVLRMPEIASLMADKRIFLSDDAMSWLWAALVVVGLEVVSLAVSFWLPEKARQSWHVFLALWLALVALVKIIQFAYLQVDGTYLSWGLFWYSLKNADGFTDLVWETAPIWVWWAFLGLYLVAWAFIHWGWRRAGVGSRKHAAMALAVGAIALSAGLGGQQVIQGISAEAALGGTPLAIAPDELPEIFVSDPKKPVRLAATQDSIQKNVVVVALESTRRDALTPYNPDVLTSPFLDKIAKEGLIVERAYASQAHTSKSLVSILCGYPSNVSSGVTEAREDGLPHDCLPKLLETQGYRSAFFQPAKKSFENREQLVKNMGFDYFVSLEDLDRERFEPTTYFGIEERAMMEPLLDWVDENDKPFFLSILTLSSHHNYKTPASFEKKHFSDDELQNDYLNTVHYVDIFLSEVSSAFEQRGLLDSTIFVFVADHGEGLYTHGQLGHHALFDESVRVPLIVWAKDLVEPGSVSGLRQQIDIAPTIFDLLNFEVEGSQLGQSLLEESRRKALFGQCFFRRCEGKITEDKKIIFYPHEKKVEVYDLARDPGELNSLPAEEAAGEVEYAQRQVAAWQQKVTEWYDQ